MKNVALQARSHAEVANGLVVGPLDAVVVWNFVVGLYPGKLEVVPTGAAYPATRVTLLGLTSSEHPALRDHLPGVVPATGGAGNLCPIRLQEGKRVADSRAGVGLRCRKDGILNPKSESSTGRGFGFRISVFGFFDGFYSTLTR